MPIYMDRHDLSGATAKDVAEAHQKDLSIQDRFGCKGLTYWFDEERGTAFCLVEAPNINCVKEMHDHAHGLVPHQIIEVESNVVEAFLGRIHDPIVKSKIDNSGLLILNDPAFRAIMSINLEEFELINYRVDDAVAEKIPKAYHRMVEVALMEFKGRRVEHVRKGFLVSFSSISNAINCAIELQSGCKKECARLNTQLNLKIGLSAGVPVTDSNAFFGDTVQRARQLCEAAKGGQSLISSTLVTYLRTDAVEQFNKKDSIKVLSLEEEEFIEKLNQSSATLWNKPGFTIELFNTKMGLSRSQLYRKLTALTGLSPSDYIKEYRLKMSLKRLTESQGNISEIAYDSGFSSPSYFSKCFQKKYGLSPSDFLQSKQA